MSPSQISATGAEYVKYLPKPINDNLINNFRQTGVNNITEDRWGGRIDYNLNENNLFHGFFSLGPINTTNETNIFLAPISTYGASVGNNNLALARLGYDHTFSASLLMHLGAGYNYDTQNGTAPYSNVVNTFGIGNALPITPQFYCNLNLCPYASTGGGGGSTNKENTYIGSGFVSWTKGKNQMKVGGGIRQD